MPEAYLFDFDGVLVDSMPVFASVMLRILRENGISYPEDIVRIITPLGYAGTARYFAGLGLPLPEEEIVSLMYRYAADEYRYRIPAKAHACETLRRLKERGADLNVLSASPHTMLDPCLKRLGLYELFTNVWSCDDFGLTKAETQIYRMAAERLGRRAEDVLFLDDNCGAVKTAKAAGMRVCGVYDAASGDDADAISAAADRYIRDFSQLLTSAAADPAERE